MKTFWQSFLGSLLALILLPMLFGGLLILTFLLQEDAWGKSKGGPLKKPAVLHLKFDHPLPEKKRPFSFDFFSMGGDLENMFKRTEQLTLREAMKRLRQAAGDPKIKGVFLDLTEMHPDYYSNSEALKLMEMRRLIDSIRAAGKPVIAYSEYFMMPQWIVGSAADSFFIHPYGVAFLTGVKAQALYLRGLLDKLKITPIELRVGKYKSAAETIARREMSEGQREQLQRMIEVFYRYNYVGPGTHRGLRPDDVDSAIRRGDFLFDIPKLEMEGLVDGRRTRDEVEAIVGQWVDDDRPLKDKLVTLQAYRGKSKIPSTSNRIGLIVAEGGIVMQGDPKEQIVAPELIRLIRKAKDDDHIKAVVLRVNSPGGDALASEMIHREIQLLRQEKPVVVSMGSVAASGGYYISCGADSIFAYPTTITGSIGVIGLWLNPERLIKEELDVNPYTLKIGKYADLPNMTRPITEDERQRMIRFLHHIYGVFIRRVAEGRALDTAYVRSIAGGRVWMGVDAKEKGLVDALGTYDDAVEAAAQLAGIDEYRVRYIRSSKKKLTIPLTFDVRAVLTTLLPPEYRTAAEQLARWTQTTTPFSPFQMVMPFILVE